MKIITGKTHHSFQLRTHLTFFLALFFCGIILANLHFSDETFWIGFQVENILKQFQIPSASFASLAVWFLKNRLALWLILCLAGYFYRCNLFYLLTTGWFGFSSGFFFTTLIRHFGLISFPLIPGLFAPHLPFYLAAYILLIKNNLHRERAYYLKCLLLSLIYAGGVFCEYYCNPRILQKIYHLTTLIS